MKRISLLAIACLAALPAISSAAQLGKVQVKLGGTSAYNTSLIKAYVTGVGYKEYRAGLMGVVENTTPPVGYLADLPGTEEADPFNSAYTAAFCIDLGSGENIGTSYRDYVVESDLGAAPQAVGSYTWESMGANKAKAVRQLWYTYFEDDTAPYDDVAHSVSRSSVESTAFQIAVHEIVFDTFGYGGWEVDSSASGKGSYYVFDDGHSGAAVALANTWLASLGSQDKMAYLYALVAPVNQQGVTNYAQDLIYQYQDGGEEVPEPSTLVGLLGLTIMGGLGYRRRRRQR